MHLPNVVHSFGKAMRCKYGEKVHKISINAAMTCPNMDGTSGRGGCTFCNNASFNMNVKKPPPIMEQLSAGKRVIRRRTGAKKYIAYFQAYTNTYADVDYLKQLYDSALADPLIIGLCIGTRPDCVPETVLRLLENYQQQGYEVWLELGLQSAFDKSLERVNRGHNFADYVDAVNRAQTHNIQICTHLIIGLPGETPEQSLISHSRVMDIGTQGLKLHPLHVVKGTQLAKQWRRGEYQAMEFERYIDVAATIIRKTSDSIIFHRLTATASSDILLAPKWCSEKWSVLNAIHDRLCTFKNSDSRKIN
jgi:radical SAM protein (TIGR01212 family)